MIFVRARIISNPLCPYVVCSPHTQNKSRSKNLSARGHCDSAYRKHTNKKIKIKESFKQHWNHCQWNLRCQKREIKHLLCPCVVCRTNHKIYKRASAHECMFACTFARAHVHLYTNLHPLIEVRFFCRRHRVMDLRARAYKQNTHTHTHTYTHTSNYLMCMSCARVHGCRRVCG